MWVWLRHSIARGPPLMATIWDKGPSSPARTMRRASEMPWITGMAQVYGREKNTFKDEILLDRHYIENYSIFLDIIIFIRTFMVVIERIWKK